MFQRLLGLMSGKKLSSFVLSMAEKSRWLHGTAGGINEDLRKAEVLDAGHT